MNNRRLRFNGARPSCKSFLRGSRHLSANIRGARCDARGNTCCKDAFDRYLRQACRATHTFPEVVQDRARTVKIDGRKRVYCKKTKERRSIRSSHALFSLANQAGISELYILFYNRDFLRASRKALLLRKPRADQREDMELRTNETTCWRVSCIETREESASRISRC